MAAEVSFTKRAAAELSRCFNGLTVRSKSGTTAGRTQTYTVNRTDSSILERRRAHRSARIRDYLATIVKPCSTLDMWQDAGFLIRLFSYIATRDRPVLAQVCRSWRDIIYQPRYWKGLMPIFNLREMRNCSGVDGRKRMYHSIERRGLESLCLFGANDNDAYHLAAHFPVQYVKHVRHLSLRCSNVTDKGLETLLATLQFVNQLELSGCNEITDAGFWASLSPRIVSLTLTDCINVADDSVSAIAQLLPSLCELNLQAYHVTDSGLATFGPRQSSSLSVLRLKSCWEITNHGVLNVVHVLPNLTVLSLSGCSKITDDGIELLAENLRLLRVLDLSWCPRITDSSLEYIACDLTLLEELTLDRCGQITDVGLGYLSTMANLMVLYLRWCTQIRDYGIQHLCRMRNLQVISLAGCPLITSAGLSSLAQLRHLQELELTNCPCVTKELIHFLHENLPRCLIIE